MRETELYEPVRDYLQQQGYQVQAEVKNCDIAAVRDDELIVVELKTRANLTLLVQATDRQRITDSVYVAIPQPRSRGGHWRGIRRVLRMLELGLMVVTFGITGPRVRVEFDPSPYQRRKTRRRRRAVLQEISDRSGAYNTGGSSARRLITAYRENAILIACCLEMRGPLSPRELRTHGTGEKTLAILSKDYYGWFQRIERAVYQITEKGTRDLRDYPELRARSYNILQNE